MIKKTLWMVIMILSSFAPFACSSAGDNVVQSSNQSSNRSENKSENKSENMLVLK